MTAHELAIALLAMPDNVVVVSDEGHLNEIKSLDTEGDVVRLFRID